MPDENSHSRRRRPASWSPTRRPILDQRRKMRNRCRGQSPRSIPLNAVPRSLGPGRESCRDQESPTIRKLAKTRFEEKTQSVARLVAAHPGEICYDMAWQVPRWGLPTDRRPGCCHGRAAHSVLSLAAVGCVCKARGPVPADGALPSPSPIIRSLVHAYVDRFASVCQPDWT